MRMKQYTIPIFVPHLGCPFDCVFCNQERITAASTNVKAEDVRTTIEEYLSYFTRQDRYIEVGFFGGSFTGIKKEIQESLLSVAYEYKQAGKIHGIRLSTRPDFIDPDILAMLKAYGVDTIELGVQSLSEDVLLESGRGHTSQVVYRAAELIKESGINLGLQMMLGLPADSYEKSLYTTEEFIKMDPFCVRIYPTLVIKDTELEEAYKNKTYEPLSLEEAVEASSEYLMRYELADINVIRLGLQATENIQIGRDVVAGPFHPSFGQMVKSNIYLKIIGVFLEDHREEIDSKDLEIHTSSRNISNIVGQKASNKKSLRDTYHIRDLIVREKDLEGKDLEILINGSIYRIDYMENIRKYIEN